MTHQPTVADRAALVADYPLALLKTKSEERRQQGLPVLDLSSGNPAYPPSTAVRETLLKEWSQDSSYSYPGYEPLPALSKAIGNWYEQSAQVNFADKQVVLTAGAKEGIWLAYLVLFNPGEEVLIPNPGYPAYVELASLFSVVPRLYELSAATDFVPTIDQLEKLVTPQTKGIWLNYPGNPTGAMVTAAQLTELVEWATEHGLWILSDYAYSQVCYHTKTAPSAFISPTASKNVVELSSASKILSMAGVRVGWITAHHSVAARFQAIVSQLGSGLPRPHQLAVAAGLKNSMGEWHETMVAHYAEQRDWVARLLTKLGVKFELPAAGLYIWGEVPADFKYQPQADAPALSPGEAYAEWLLTTYGIVVVPGTAFGSAGHNYIRASFSHQLDKEQVLKVV